MKKKLLVAFLAVVSCCLLALSLTACGEKPHEHTYETTVVAPTCTEQGYTLHTCTGCDENYKDTYVDALGHSFTEYISDNNATYEKDGTKTAICDRVGCNITDVIIEEGTKLKSEITFKTLSVSGADVYGIVSNTTKMFSFINEVTAVGAAKFVVSLDIYGIQQVATKTISLSPGDNIVYITEIVDDEPINVYTVNVRRRPMYEVTFNTSGGSTVENQTVEEGSWASQPTTERSGYTFNSWDFDFNTPITQNTTITASWTVHTDTAYKVEYYLQNIEDDEYTLQTTEYKTGTTDTTANAEIKTFEYFTYNTSNSIVSGNINGDGSTVLKVYYTRDTYTVTFDGNGGTLVEGDESQTVKYGGSVTAPTFEKAGYTFSGYDKTNYTNISESFTATATWTINQYTLTIVYINGQENTVIAQDYNTPIETIANPLRAGYDFAGWDKEIPTAMPAEDVTVTANWNAIFTLSEGTVTGLTNYGKSNYLEINIPSQIDGITITSIGEKAFDLYSRLTSITIPNSVTSIGDSAFDTCRSLTSISIPNSVTSIGDSAFENCHNLTSITLPNSIKSISKDLFLCCDSLTSITIPENVTSIGSMAFEGCSNLTNITIPDNVTRIGFHAFSDCSSLTSVTFVNTSGWKVSTTSDTAISSTDLADASTAATYLKSTYNIYNWQRS